MFYVFCVLYVCFASGHNKQLITVHLRLRVSVMMQSTDRGGTSVQSKTKSLTPFRLRSNREGLAALCQQASVSTLSGPRLSMDHHRPSAESMSTSPQLSRRHAVTSGQEQAASSRMVGEMSGAGSSASLDSRSRSQLAAEGPRWWDPTRTLTAGTPAGDGGSEYGSCISLDSTDRAAAAGPADAAEMSSAIDSDASEWRRRRRAELVRARTAGARTTFGDVHQTADGESATTEHPVTASTDNMTTRPFVVSASTSTSSPALHVNSSASRHVDAELLPVVAQPRATAEHSTTKNQQSFQQTHSKTPWRSTRATTIDTPTPHDVIPSRPLDNASRHVSDHPQCISPQTTIPTPSFQSSSSNIASSSRSSSSTSVEGVRNELRKPTETRLKASSVYGSAPSVAASDQSLTTDPAVTATSAAVTTGRPKPRLTIYSSDKRDAADNKASLGTGHQAAQMKDRFNELVGKALESTVPAGGHPFQSHGEHLTEVPHHHKSLEEIVEDRNTARSLQQEKEESEVESTARDVVDRFATERQSGEPALRTFNKKPTSGLSVTTDGTQSIAVSSNQQLKPTVDNKTIQLTSRKTAAGKPQPTKQYISDSTAFVAVTTHITPATSPSTVLSQKSITGSSQQSEESEPGRQHLTHDFTKQCVSEGRTDNISRLDALNAAYLEKSQNASHPKLQSSPSSSFAQSQKTQPRIGKDLEVVETKEESCLQERQNVLQDSEDIAGKISDLQNFYEPSVSSSPLKKSPRLDTTISIKTSIKTCEDPSQLNTVDNNTGITHSTNANVFQYSRSENAQVASKSVGISGKLENRIASELAADIKKESTEQYSESQTDKSHSKGSQSRRPNVVEETQIMHILTVGGGDAKAHCSTSTNVETSAIDASDNLAVSTKTDLFVFKPSELDQQKAESSVFRALENITKIPVDELSKLSQTLSSTSSQDVIGQTVSEPHISDIAQQSLATNQQLNCSGTAGSNNIISNEPNIELKDIVSVGFKPSTVLRRQIHQAKLVDVQPWLEQDVKKICQLEQQTVVTQEVESSVEQVLFTDEETEIERVKPENVECSVNIADCRRCLTRTGSNCDNALTAAAIAESGDNGADTISERIGYIEELPEPKRLKLQNVESTFHAIDSRRLLTKAHCQYHANLQTPAAIEIGKIEVKAGYMQNDARFQQVKPQKVESSFRSVSPLLKRTSWHYNTNLVTFHPTDRDAIVPAGRFRQPAAVDQTKETTGIIDPIKSESRKPTTVQNRARETAEVVSLPTILTMPSHLGQLMTARKVNYQGEITTYALKQMTEQKLLPSVFGKNVPSNKTPSALPVVEQKVEITRSFNQQMSNTNTRQAVFNSSSAGSSDMSSSSVQVRRASDGFAKTSGNMPLLVLDRAQDGQTVSLSSNHVGFVTASEITSVVEQNCAKFPAVPGSDGASAAAVTGRRDSPIKKARNILRSREDFLSLSTSTSCDVFEEFSTDLQHQTSSGQLEQSTCNTTTGTAVKNDKVDTASDSHSAIKTVKIALRDDELADEDDVDEVYTVAAADSAVKAAFPPLVSGRSWDAVVRFSSSSVDEPAEGALVERRATGTGQNSSTSRQALSTARADITSTPGTLDRRKVSWPITQFAKSLDAEPLPPVNGNIAPGEVEDDQALRVVPADTAKAAFPPLVTGRSWDAIVRFSSSSMEEPSVVDAAGLSQTTAATRQAFTAARTETTAVVSDKVKVSRPILQLAKSVDTEPRTVNIDPQLAAVLRMRKQREEELEREEAELRSEEANNWQNFENRHGKPIRLFCLCILIQVFFYMWKTLMHSKNV